MQCTAGLDANATRLGAASSHADSGRRASMEEEGFCRWVVCRSGEWRGSQKNDTGSDWSLEYEIRSLCGSLVHPQRGAIQYLPNNNAAK